MEALDDVNLLLNRMTEIERIAEGILTDKEDLIALDRRRNKTREAVRQLEGMGKEGAPSNGKVWMAMGQLFVKVPATKAKDMLKKDHSQLGVEIGKLREELKVEMNHLQDAEMKPEIVGFNLKPLSKEETAAIHKVITG